MPRLSRAASRPPVRRGLPGVSSERLDGPGWDTYVDRFHGDHPGVTEALLLASRDAQGGTPYEWLAEGASDGLAVDVGCGSGPSYPASAEWIGIDRSRAELDAARREGRGPLVRASASHLPIGDHVADAALAAMSLMVFDDPASAVVEVARVLRPGGTMEILLPGDGPLTVADRVRYGVLLAVLGRRSVPFPRPEVVADPGPLLASVGFEIVSDERRRFRFGVGGRSDADLFVDGLYLPQIGARRLRLVRALVRSRVVGEIGIPLRRIRARLAR